MNTLNVRNRAQQILWEELDGQISDGKWENARPMDHWKVWCNVAVVVDPINVGRNFYARKDNYNFTDKELLSIVGDRMLESVRRELPLYNWTDMMYDLKDLKRIIRTDRNAVLSPGHSDPHFWDSAEQRRAREPESTSEHRVNVLLQSDAGVNKTDLMHEDATFGGLEVLWS